MLNEFFCLKTAFKTASENDDVIIIVIFIINQMILRKILIIIMKMKDYLSDKRKSDLFDIQKLQLQKIMMINNIACDMLNAY